MADRRELDPNHSDKQAGLNGVGVLLLVIGLPCALIGICSFMSNFFTSSSDFFANPNQVMDSEKSHAAIGIIMMMVGVPMSAFGLNLLGFANRGKIARYQAGEVVPVVKDIVSDTAPVISEVTREMAKALREGYAGEDATAPHMVRHSCGTLNHETDTFCKGCGQPLGCKRCPNCESINDADAAFCQKCGSKLA